MDTKTIVILAAAGFGLWFLLRQQATAARSVYQTPQVKPIYDLAPVSATLIDVAKIQQQIKDIFSGGKTMTYAEKVQAARQEQIAAGQI